MFKKRGCFAVIALLVLILGSFAVSAAVSHNANNISIKLGVSNMTLQSFVSYNVSLKLIDQNGNYDTLTTRDGTFIKYTNCAQESKATCESHTIIGWYNPSNILLSRDDNCGSCSIPPIYQDTDCLGLGGSDWYDCNGGLVVQGNCDNLGFDNTPSCKTMTVKGWYNSYDELLLQDNNCNTGFLGFGADYGSCTLGTSYNNSLPSNIHNKYLHWQYLPIQPCR